MHVCQMDTRRSKSLESETLFKGACEGKIDDRAALYFNSEAIEQPLFDASYLQRVEINRIGLCPLRIYSFWIHNHAQSLNSSNLEREYKIVLHRVFDEIALA